ncbi:MAG: aminotransferase class I/II-fold pyridoxal phosphate-dependent enzyme, partial [Agitococcus sp.]|nr:aminotransferase class I/II-fold pyridoxal phosphate-dependent enzyme [Agitococcus sp.]
MSCDFLALANQGVQKLSPYQTGKPIDELKRELGLDDIIKLASNENPLGCSPLAVQAIQAEMNQIGRYPDGNGFNLKYAIQQKFGFELNRMTLGNGSNDILELVARAFIAQGQAAIYSQHAFAVYPLAVQAVGGVGIEVPAKNFGHDLDAMAAAITANTKVVFIANPNNPTGTWFGRAEFEQFMAQVPDSVLVVLDEAYVEYVTDADFINGFDYVNQYPNLLVSRTFSKAYGLASLRVGYAIASPDVTNILNRVR